MNKFVVIPLVVTLSLALVACIARQNPAALPSPPPSCSLPSLSVAQREQHERRCDLIRQSAFAPIINREGFRFWIDLKKMPMVALQEWAGNEQGCCSFLQITVRSTRIETIAEVQVVCAPEFKKETMKTLGLNSP